MSFGGKGKASRVSPGTPLIPFPVSSWPCLSAEGTSNLGSLNPVPCLAKFSGMPGIVPIITGSCASSPSR